LGSSIVYTGYEDHAAPLQGGLAAQGSPHPHQGRQTGNSCSVQTRPPRPKRMESRTRLCLLLQLEVAAAARCTMFQLEAAAAARCTMFQLEVAAAARCTMLQLEAAAMAG
jgi:hypothetical protein